MEEKSSQINQQNEIENEIAEIKKRLLKSEENKKWYKNNSFVLSIVVFIFSASTSLYTLSYNKKVKSETDFGSKITSIINSIENLKQFEKEYYQQLSSPLIDANTKTAINGIYYSKVSQLVEAISSKLDDITLQKLDASTLNDYGKYLLLVSRINDAIVINKIALKKCKDKYTIVTLKRTLGTLYSLPGDSQNVSISRNFRKEALMLTKSYTGEYGIENTMNSFELWANDEYYNLQNREYANLLIDSALFYAEKLQEYNSRKPENIKRLKTIRSYFNNKLNINFSNGRWKVYQTKKQIGSATLINLGNSLYFDIDLTSGDSLIKKIYGNGNFAGDDRMKFSLTSNYLIQVMDNMYNKQSYPQTRVATLEIIILKNKLLNAKYKELGQKEETWSIVYNEE